MNPTARFATSIVVALFLFGMTPWASPVAFAQKSPQLQPTSAPSHTRKKPTKLQRITVTGTAIPRTSTVIATPVMVITASQIKALGFTTVTAVLRHLPIDNSGTIPTAFTAGFAAGSSGIALDGLRSSSTLVLLDGHRTAPYALDDDGQRSFTDLSSIPLNAVERIEVLKGSASSIYGSSAIAGVVNIILYPTYRGTRITAEAGMSQHGGGAMTRFTLITGTGSVRKNGYNAYLSVEYQNNQAIYNHDRGFPFNTGNLTPLGGLDFNGGNPVLDSGSIYGTVAPATLGTPGNLLTGQQIPGTQYQPLRACGPFSTPVSVNPFTGSGQGTYCEENFVSQYGEVAPQVTRAALDGHMTFKVKRTNRIRVNAIYSQVRVVSTGGPAQIQNSVPTNTNALALPPVLLNGSLNPNDPFASQGEYALINYAFGDIPSANVYSNHNLRLGISATGELNRNWDYHAFVVINHTWLNEVSDGLIDGNQLLSDIQTGAYSFINPASNSAAVVNALSPQIDQTATTDMDEAGLDANGFLWHLPGGRVGVAVGSQWRYDAQDEPQLNPGLIYQGLGFTQIIGSHSAAAFYAEVNLPVMRSRRFGYLDFDLSGREDRYSDFGSAFTHKFGVIYRPIRQIALRGTFATGFRAPSFAENGSSSTEGFVTETLPASFIAAHHNDAYVQPYGLGLLATGNPNIQPERSQSYTLGLVLSPVSSFNATLDYYNILETGVISQASPFTALSDYFAGVPLPPGDTVTPDVPDPLFPKLLPRPILVAAPYINQNELRTDGVDLDMNYHHSLFGRVMWDSRLAFAKIITFEESLTPGGPLVSFVGDQAPYILSSGAGTPRYRGNWSNSFTYGPFSLTATVYYVSGLFMSVPDLTGPGTGNLCFSTATPTGANLPSNCRMPSFTYIDMNATYRLTPRLSLLAGVENVTDRTPPFDPIDYAANNYNPTYDYAGIVGRFFKVGLNYRF